MDFEFNEDQIEIARQARRFFENETPMEYVREMFEDDRGFTDEVWAKMAEMGWTALRIPEEYGGLDMDQISLSVILLEMGRTVLPGPFFSTVMLAAETIIAAGSGDQKEKYLPGIASGELRGTVAINEADGGADPSYIQMPATANDDGFILNGEKLHVPDAHTADFIICAARTEAGNDPDHGVSLFVLDTNTAGLTITPLVTMDGSRKISAVTFNDVAVGNDALLGELNSGWAPLSEMLRRAQAGLCAECVGGSEWVVETVIEHAKIRNQFGQPIGAFQAIKHQCSQMFVEMESSRSALLWTIWAQDYADAAEAALSSAVAKSYCTEVFRNVSTAGIQILGGTGFSWEHDMHLYLKRAKLNEVTLGDPFYHRELVTAHLESQARSE